MAVKIRLLRLGRKKKPFYRIVAIDSRSRRDGRYLDKLGYYDPLTKPATVQLEKEKIAKWLDQGAVPTETVFNLLQKAGIALEYHLIRNKVSEQTRNIEIQKWEMAKKMHAPQVPKESIEKSGTAEPIVPESTPDEPGEPSQPNSDNSD